MKKIERAQWKKMGLPNNPIDLLLIFGWVILIIILAIIPARFLKKK